MGSPFFQKQEFWGGVTMGSPYFIKQELEEKSCDKFESPISAISG
jgi:hypothetical protein